MTNELSKRKLISNTLFLTVGTAFSKMLQFIMLPFFTKWLRADEYGMFDLLCTYVTLFLPVLTLATGEAVFRFVSDNESTEEEKKSIITNGFFVTILNYLLFLLVFIGLRATDIINLSWIFLFLLLGQLLFYYLQACLRGLKKLELYSVSNFAFALLVAIVSYILVYVCQLGLSGMLLAYAIAYVGVDIFLFFFIRMWKYVEIKGIKFSVIKKMIRYSFPLVPNDISWWVLNVSDRQIINIFHGSVANGIYAVANKIPALCTSVFGMFGISWQQSIVEQIYDKEWEEYCKGMYNRTITVLCSLCTIIMSANFFIYEFLFSESYQSGIGVVPILLTAIIFSTLMQFFGGIQIALKNTKDNGITTIIGGMINILLNLVFVPSGGIYAAAMTTLIANIVTVLLRRIRLLRYVKFKLDFKAWEAIIYYILIVLFTYVPNLTWILRCGGFLVAMVLFLKVNKDLIKKIVSK